MSEPQEPRDHQWVERVVRVAGVLGFNEVKLRWKLLRWAEQRGSTRRRLAEAVSHVSYQHAVCQQCGAIQPRGTRVCVRCEAPMASRLTQMMTRLGFYLPVPASGATALGVLILLCYARQCIAAGGFWSFDGPTLLSLGAHVPALEHAGQLWRLGTAVFLHVGLIHLGFNLLALSSLGPAIEEVFGTPRTVFYFVVLGIAANVPTFLLMPEHYPGNVGASGAISGLMGMAAGWGQRDGTAHGRGVRNQMLKWMLYTTVFGIVVHADHAAHWTGMIAGAVVGYLAAPMVRGRARTLPDAAMGTIGWATALALVVLVMIGPRLLPAGL